MTGSLPAAIDKRANQSMSQPACKTGKRFVWKHAKQNKTKQNGSKQNVFPRGAGAAGINRLNYSGQHWPSSMINLNDVSDPKQASARGRIAGPRLCCAWH